MVFTYSVYAFYDIEKGHSNIFEEPHIVIGRSFRDENKRSRHHQMRCNLSSSSKDFVHFLTYLQLKKPHFLEYVSL